MNGGDIITPPILERYELKFVIPDSMIDPISDLEWLHDIKIEDALVLGEVRVMVHRGQPIGIPLKFEPCIQ